jgi:hypothetical protein
MNLEEPSLIHAFRGLSLQTNICEHANDGKLQNRWKYHRLINIFVETEIEALESKKGSQTFIEGWLMYF